MLLRSRDKLIPLLTVHYFCSSSSLNRLTLKKQKAFLSIEVIDLIKQSPLNNSQQGYSLTQKILQKINSKKDFSEQSKKAVSSLFKGGVKIDSLVFNFVNITQITDSKLKKAPNKPFIFYPTRLVTSHIFQKISQTDSANIIVAGQDGISKTVSVCLYWHLAKFVDDYRFEKGAQISDNILRIPKFIYWSPIRKVAPLTEMKQIIMRQCPEIKRKLKRSVFQTTQQTIDFHQLINPIFQDLKTVLIVDDTDSLVDLDKNCSQSKKKPKEQRNQLQVRELNYMEQTNRALKILKSHFRAIMYISSLDFDESFSAKYDLSGNINHTQPDIHRLNYSKTISQPENLTELIQYFLFLMEQHAFNLKELIPFYNAEAKKQITKKCLESIIKQKPPFFITLLCCRTSITGQKLKKSFTTTKITSSQMLINTTVQYFKNIVSESTTFFLSQLGKNFNKKDQKSELKMCFILQLFNGITTSIKRHSKLHQPKERFIHHNSQQTENTHTIKISSLFDFSQAQIGQLIDKRFFHFEDNQITLFLPHQLVMRFLISYLSQRVEKVFPTLEKSLSRFSKRKELESLVENLLLLILNRGEITVSFKFKNQQEKTINQEFNLNSRSVYSFQAQYNQSDRSKTTLLDTLLPSINTAIQNGHQQFLLLPVVSNPTTITQDNRLLEVLRSGGKNIQAILVKSQQFKEKKYLDIWLMGLGLSEDKTSTKLSTLLTQLPNIHNLQDKHITINNQQYQLQINYLLLGPQQTSQQLLKFINQHSNLSLSFPTPSSSNQLNSNLTNNPLIQTLQHIGYLELGSNLLLKNQNQSLLQGIEFINLKLQNHQY